MHDAHTRRNGRCVPAAGGGRPNIAAKHTVHRRGVEHAQRQNGPYRSTVRERSARAAFPSSCSARYPRFCTHAALRAAPSSWGWFRSPCPTCDSRACPRNQRQQGRRPDRQHSEATQAISPQMHAPLCPPRSPGRVPGIALPAPLSATSRRGGGSAGGR